MRSTHRHSEFPRLENHARLSNFAPFRIAYAEGCHFANGRMPVNDRFDRFLPPRVACSMERQLHPASRTHKELEVIGLVREKKGQPISGSKAMPG
jgi:hypothetical protein